ncbi:MAG: hypothetical protein HYY53_04190 [candidate division NC10 bacterium]|nr:hypothetical protein [candidate division NC10 bacterium]
MAGKRGRPGRAYLVRWGSQMVAVRTLADGRVLVQPVPPRSVVAPARSARERQDRLLCQGCGEPFAAIDMWIDAEGPRRGFCDRCSYACRGRERAAEEG